MHFELQEIERKHILSQVILHRKEKNHIVRSAGHVSVFMSVSLFRFVSLSQMAMELEVSADSDQMELLLLLTADWSLALVFSLQPRDLRMSRS